MRHLTATVITICATALFATAATAQLSAPTGAAPSAMGSTGSGSATPGSTLPPLTAPTSVTPNAGAPGASGRTDPTNPNNPNDSLRSGLDRTAKGLTDSTNALGSPTAERADASWCRTAGLNANDMQGCVSRMNTAGTDQQRADIQSTYRSHAGSNAVQSSGGSNTMNSHLDTGLGAGAASSRNTSSGLPR